MLAEKHGTSVLCVVSPIACHTMANENQGTDRESDVFDVLKRYDIVFVDHVQCLLKNLGYKCLRSISSITAGLDRSRSFSDPITRSINDQ